MSRNGGPLGGGEDFGGWEALTSFPTSGLRFVKCCVAIIRRARHSSTPSSRRTIVLRPPAAGLSQARMRPQI